MIHVRVVTSMGNKFVILEDGALQDMWIPLEELPSFIETLEKLKNDSE